MEFLAECSLEAGSYYVSVVDGGRFNVLAGPYGTHKEAIAMVDPTRAIANELDARSHFYGFGTVRMKDGYNKPGMLNKYLEKEGAAI